MSEPQPGSETRRPSIPGSVGDVRRTNLALALTSIARAAPSGPITRAQLATATGLTKASISSLVLDLLTGGVVREVALEPRAERGRPGVGLEMNPGRAVVGMEINVDYIAAELVSLTRERLLCVKRFRDNRGSSAADVMADLAELVNTLLAEAADRGIAVIGGGLAVPGLIDQATSTVLTAPNLGWSGETLDARGLLPEARLGVTLLNEANAAALAEVRSRTGTAGPDFVFVSGEVGVGAGFVIAGSLFVGPAGHAGEIGHLVLEPEGLPCSCGGIGCLETIAGQDAILRAAGLADDPLETDMSRLLSALSSGESMAVAAVQRAATFLGMALVSTARLMGVSTVVLGGHFAVLAHWLVPPLFESMQRHAPGLIRADRVLLSSAGEGGAAFGCAGSVVQSLLDAPQFLIRPGPADVAEHP